MPLTTQQLLPSAGAAPLRFSLNFNSVAAFEYTSSRDCMTQGEDAAPYTLHLPPGVAVKGDNSDPGK